MKIFKSTALALMLSACAAQAVPAAEKPSLDRVISETSFILTSRPYCLINLDQKAVMDIMNRAVLAVEESGITDAEAKAMITASIDEMVKAWTGAGRDVIVDSCHAVIWVLRTIGFNMKLGEKWEEGILESWDARNGVAPTPKPKPVPGRDS